MTWKLTTQHRSHDLKSCIKMSVGFHLFSGQDIFWLWREYPLPIICIMSCLVSDWAALGVAYRKVELAGTYVTGVQDLQYFDVHWKGKKIILSMTGELSHCHTAQSRFQEFVVNLSCHLDTTPPSANPFYVPRTSKKTVTLRCELWLNIVWETKGLLWQIVSHAGKPLQAAYWLCPQEVQGSKGEVLAWLLKPSLSWNVSVNAHRQAGWSVHVQYVPHNPAKSLIRVWKWDLKGHFTNNNKNFKNVAWM